MTANDETLCRLTPTDIGNRFITALEGPPERTLLSPQQLVHVLRAGATIAENARQFLLEFAIRRSGADNHKEPIPDVSADALTDLVAAELEGPDRIHGVLSDDARARVATVADEIAAEIAELSGTVTIRMLSALDRVVPSWARG